MPDLNWLRRRRPVSLAISRIAPFIAPARSRARVSDDTPGLEAAPPLLIRWPDDVARPRVGLVQDTDEHPYWTKYRRFLESNSFPFRLVDVHTSEWVATLADLDMIVWRPGSEPDKLEEARRKIFFLQDFLGLRTYPTLRALTLYEDKILQSWALQHVGAETPPTVASFSLPDALDGLVHLGPEVVWKVSTSSASADVQRLNARGAKAAARRAFSWRGRRTSWPFENQKGYVYAQGLERGLDTDMRIVVVGPLLFGYYRDPPGGDFRASGMGRVRKEALPTAAMEEAWQLAHRLDVGAVAVDFIVSRDLQRWKVIEFSSFIEVLTSGQLEVDKRPGVYVRLLPGEFAFRPGRYWLQELALAEALGQACDLDTDKLLLEALGAQ